MPLIGLRGILIKYRKVQPWRIYELSASPHDLLPDHKEEIFPVANTPIGNIGLSICYDFSFPETTRQLVYNGAEIICNAEAHMDPFGAGTYTPEGAATMVLRTRGRAIDAISYVAVCNVGSTLQELPPFSWPGQSMITDYLGRVIATCGPGERIIIGEVDIELLREYRKGIFFSIISCGGKN